jgi:hypothetical protein
VVLRDAPGLGPVVLGEEGRSTHTTAWLLLDAAAASNASLQEAKGDGGRSRRGGETGGCSLLAIFQGTALDEKVDAARGCRCFNDTGGGREACAALLVS